MCKQDLGIDQVYSQVESELLDRFVPRRINTNQKLIESYDRLGMTEIADHIRQCGTALDFRAPADFSSAPKLFRANFCKERLCSMCAWRRSLKVFGQVSQIMDKLQASNYQFVFLTLTLRNCSGSELPFVFDDFSKGFNKFKQRAPIKRAFKGFFRAYEVTFHPEKRHLGMEYHPHIHLIGVVNKSYFVSKNYLNQSQLQKIWKEVCEIDYDPYIYVCKVYPGIDKQTGEINLKDAVAEAAKYTIKPDTIFDEVYCNNDEMDQAVYELTAALAHRRLCSFTGVFKKVAKELELDDLTDGDLVQTDNERIRSDVGWIIITYRWNVGYGYERAHVRFEEEKEKEKK